MTSRIRKAEKTYQAAALEYCEALRHDARTLATLIEEIGHGHRMSAKLRKFIVPESEREAFFAQRD